MQSLKQFSVLGLMILAILTSSCGGNKTAMSAKDARLWEYKKEFTNFYSLKDDVALGEQVQKQQFESAKEKGMPVDPRSQARLRRRIQKIVGRLAKVSDHPKLPYEVHIYDAPDIANAFCMPGGKIGVFTGLFDPKNGLYVDIKSDDEIAAVLGHEIAHATLRHVTRRITTYQSVGIVGGLVGLGVGKAAGSVSQSVFSKVFNVSTSLAVPSYSRGHETEADKVGFYYMVKAGYDPNAAIRIWSRLDERLKKAGKDKQSFFASHPSSGNRAQFLTGYLPDAKIVQQRGH